MDVEWLAAARAALAESFEPETNGLIAIGEHASFKK
jgi:hypothetical protein